MLSKTISVLYKLLLINKSIAIIVNINNWRNSDEVRKLFMYFFFNDIKLKDELLVARNPVDHRVCQLLLVFRCLMARLKVFLGLFLQTMSKLTALSDALATYVKTLVDLGQGALSRIEAVH